MSIITTKENVLHPEGKIILRSGAVLDCYPKMDCPKESISDDLSVDSSGEFLSLKKIPSTKKDPERIPRWEELFLKEAFFLHRNKERILSDSRMFLTPLPFRSGLAYTGTSGMEEPTLGTYLEWWEDCPRSVIEHNGKPFALTFLIAGSPLSGSNCCTAVREDGKKISVRFPSPFSEIWSSFMRINSRYNEAKRLYEAYSLEKTIRILHEEDAEQLQKNGNDLPVYTNNLVKY